MIIVYTPAEGEPEHLDARSLKVSEVSIVSRLIDMKWPEVKQGLNDEDLDSMRGVAWVLKKRTNPSLSFSDFDPGVDELVTRLDKTEVELYVTEAVEIARQDPNVTGPQIAAALAALPAAAVDSEHAERVITEMTTEDPKDQPTPASTAGEGSGEPAQLAGQGSTSSEPSISSTSPASSTSRRPRSTN